MIPDHDCGHLLVSISGWIWQPIVGQMAVPPENFPNPLLTIPWFAWVAIVAIISGAVSGLMAQIHRHRERMAMIQQGMNPDAPGGKPIPSREL